jgi:ABC-type transporter Mla MlaB component
MIKDAKSSGFGPIHAEYGGQALRITEMSSSTGLVLTGEIDEDTYPALVAKLNEFAVGVPEIHFDLVGLEYCDLAGLLQTVLRIVGWA